MPYKDPEKQKAYLREHGKGYRKKNPASEAARKAGWLADNRDRHAARVRAWRASKKAQDAGAALSLVLGGEAE